MAAEGNLLDRAWQLADHIADVLVRRSIEKFAVALPGPSIARVDYPKTLFGEELEQKLLARDRRHAVAEDDEFLPWAGPSRRQKLGDDFLFEPSPKHVFALSRIRTGMNSSADLSRLGCSKFLEAAICSRQSKQGGIGTRRRKALVPSGCRLVFGENTTTHVESFLSEESPPGRPVRRQASHPTAI
jgi:hypothetical protein